MQFDDLQAGRMVGSYNDVTWTNFVVDNAQFAAGRCWLAPVSAPNMARLPAGRRGIMQTNGGELLFEFHYGCTTPAARRLVHPTSCLVSLTASCSYDRYSAMPQSWTFNFSTAAGEPRALAISDTSKGYIGPGYGACANYTWSAVSSNGGPVDLYLDEVIYKRVPYW